MSVRVENDHTAEVLAKLKNGIQQALEQSGTLVENVAARNAPVDTGRLRNSLTHQMKGSDSVEIGSDVEYAIYVECGTSRMGARPYLRRALEANSQQVLDIFKSSIS